MRRFAPFLTLLLAQCLGSSSPLNIEALRHEAIEIDARPVLLDPDHPDRQSVGALRYLGGWHLTSPSRAFGGLSSLTILGNRAYALSDVGALMRFRIGHFGHMSDATIDPIPLGCAGHPHNWGRDTESLAHDPATGRWWVGFEDRNAICRISGDFSQGEAVTTPRQMADWPATKGPETIVRLRDGRFIVIAEEASDGNRDRPLLVFRGDPADPDAKPIVLRYRPPEGFDPTDAAELPDGRLLVLNRRFSFWSLFAANIVIVDPIPDMPGALVSGQEIARFEPPLTTDNFEGIALTIVCGQQVVWITSDDNYMGWQRTLLMAFAFNEPVRPQPLP